MKFINTVDGHSFATKSDLRAYWDSKLLQSLYFGPKAVEDDRRQAMLCDPEFLSRVREIARIDCEVPLARECQRMFADFEQDSGCETGDERLYLIVGCGTTTIYTVEVEGEQVSVLCLESTDGNSDVLRMLLAHEFTHIVRKRQLQRDVFESCVGERLLTEGIAENYSREAMPGRPDSEYCIVEPDTVAWVSKHYAELDERIRPHLSDATLMSELFYMFADIDYPVRCGYVYGYYAVKRYLDKNGLRVRDIIAADWQSVLGKGDGA